jgi:hypothetical protein
VARHVMRYIKGTLRLGITFKCSTAATAAEPISKVVYVDASHASTPMMGSENKSLSRTGYVVMVHGGVIRCASKLQQTNAASRKLAAITGNAEDRNAHDDGKQDPPPEDYIVHQISAAGAEYVAASESFHQLVFVQQLMDEFRTLSSKEPWIVWEDNQAVIKVAEQKHGNAKLTRPLAVRHNIVHHLVEQNNVIVKLCYIKTRDQVADIFTKPNAPNFLTHRARLLKSFHATRSTDITTDAWQHLKQLDDYTHL